MSSGVLEPNHPGSGNNGHIDARFSFQQRKKARVRSSLPESLFSDFDITSAWTGTSIERQNHKLNRCFGWFELMPLILRGHAAPAFDVAVDQKSVPTCQQFSGSIISIPKNSRISCGSFYRARIAAASLWSCHTSSINTRAQICWYSIDCWTCACWNVNAKNLIGNWTQGRQLSV
jgi:hypothetical protein